MVTAFGPQGPNYTTTRPPADPQASGGTDTFFKNCSAAGAKDGTFATAAFFNTTLANLRYLVRTAGVVLDDTSDSMVYEAVQKLVLAGSGGGGGGGTTGTVPFGNPTLYVRTDGNDTTGDGSANTALKAFATIQAAIQYAQNIWSLGGKKLFIQLGIPGTYTGTVTVQNPVTGVTITGDPANQGGYIIVPPAAGGSLSQIVFAGGSSSLSLVGLTVAASRNDINFIEASYAGSISLSNVTIQASATTPFAALVAAACGTITIGGPVTVTGNFGALALSEGGGNITVQVGTSIQVTGNPTFSTAVIFCQSCGTFSLNGNMNGAAVGPQYLVVLNGVAQIFSKSIPGNTAGSTATGGQIG